MRLTARRGGDTIADRRPGRPWALTLSDRVLLVAVYWRTNPTMRQIGPLFGHALARLKTYEILRDYRRAGSTRAVTAAGIAHLHNIALAG